MGKVRIGIVGTGVMGADHAAILASGVAGAELVAVQDFDQARARAVAERAGCRVSPSAAALVADPQVDAVLVASPDATHAPLALAAIAAGKPVLVEKPVAATVADARRVVEAENAAGRRLVQVGFMRRFDPGYLAMREAVASGAMGAPLFFHCIHRNAVGPDYLTDDLVIANSAGHEFDIARFVLDEDLVAATVVSPRPSVHAANRKPQLIVLESASGVVVDVEAFVDARYGYDVRGELVCEEGTLSLAPNPPVARRSAGRDGFDVPQDWRQRFRTAYRDQLAAFAAFAGGGRPSGASAFDGLVSLVTAEAAIEAWRTRLRTPVSLPDRPALYA